MAYSTHGSIACAGCPWLIGTILADTELVQTGAKAFSTVSRHSGISTFVLIAFALCAMALYAIPPAGPDPVQSVADTAQPALTPLKVSVSAR